MVSQIISKLIVLFMLISLYMLITKIGERKKKQALIWTLLFLLPVAVLIILYNVYK